MLSTARNEGKNLRTKSKNSVDGQDDEDERGRERCLVRRRAALRYSSRAIEHTSRP